MCYVGHVTLVPSFELWTIFEVKIKMEAKFFWTSKAGKVKIHFPGTCSGTEPMPGMPHCCVVLESGEQYYWFDIGENCS